MSTIKSRTAPLPTSHVLLSYPADYVGSLPPKPLYFFDSRAVESLRTNDRNVCVVCKGKCSPSVWYSCTDCSDFNVCSDCFCAPGFEHDSHSFDEIDLAYLIEKFRSENRFTKVHGRFGEAIKLETFLRPNVRCYTCFDHTPGIKQGAWMIDEDQAGKVFDYMALSEDQKRTLGSLQQKLDIPEEVAFFILDRYCWVTDEAEAGFQNDFDGDPKAIARLLKRLDGGASWMSSHQIYMSDLARSRGKGCELCSLIYRGLAAASPVLVLHNERVQMLLNPEYIGVNIISGPESVRISDDIWKWHLAPMPGMAAPWKSMEPFPFRSRSFASEDSFSILRQWIQECISGHGHQDRCGSDRSLPTRLIAVGFNQYDSSIKLIEPLPDQRGRYIALSHCWGKIAINTTTTSNLEARKEGINPEELPATFLDAIECARRLDVPYLWIDSLCILQDSALDWQLESAKMCDYYLNAWLVVVAASAKGDTEGFLSDRSQEHCGLPLESREGSGDYDMCIRHTGAHKTMAISSRTDLYGDCTSSRAWCLQETMLARRSVSFHKSELVWAYHTKCDCECRKASFNSNSTVIRSGHLQSFATQIAPARKDGWHYAPANRPGARFADPSIGWTYSGRPFTTISSSAALYEEWRSMVVPLYTRREMTQRTDKFPALSGLAQFVGMQQSSRYLAGIWAEDIQLGLLWEVKKRTERAAPDQPLAPSFSWASVEQQVVYNTPGHVAVQPSDVSLLGSVGIELLGDDIEVVGSNQYGQVSGGTITLDALVTKVRLSLTDEKFNVCACNDSRLWTDARGRSPSSFQADTYLEETEVTDGSGSQAVTLRRSTDSGNTMRSAHLDLDCVVVADIKTPSQPSTYIYIDKDCEEYALIVLGKVEYKNGGPRYERLGKAVLVFEPGEGTRWLSQAERREVVIC